jgi:hypothetical protein
VSTAESDWIRISCPHCRREGKLPRHLKVGSKLLRCRRCNGRFYPDLDRRPEIHFIVDDRISGKIQDHPMFDRQLDNIF